MNAAVEIALSSTRIQTFMAEEQARLRDLGIASCCSFFMEAAQVATDDEAVRLLRPNFWRRLRRVFV